MGLGFLRSLAVVLVFVFLVAGASACSVNLTNEKVELRSNTDGYATSISAEDNSPIDIRVTFTINDVSGSDCAANVKVNSKIYRKTSSGDWTLYRTTTIKTQELQEDEFSFTWTDDFTVDDYYERYRVDTNIFDSNNGNLEEMSSSYIDMVNNSCSGIKLVTSDMTIDEGNDATRTFRVENNTNKTFEINNVSVLSTNALIRSGSVNYDSTVSRYSQEVVDVTINAGYVSSDSSTTATFAVSGYIDGTFCSETAIGRKSFTVTVLDTGSSGSNSGSYTSTPDCEDLRLVTKNFEMNEGSESTQIFYLENNSTKRFEVLDVQTTSNGIDLRAYYNEQYAFPGEVADIIMKATSANVFSNQTYENTIKVKGQFSDGRSCSFDNIQKRTFSTTVLDSQKASFASCNNFSINAPEAVSFENFGNIPITIVNGTNQRADIYIEGDIEASPTQISLPANSSISRELSVSLRGTNGTITLRPSVEGCYYATKRISVSNTAKGTLSALTMTASVEEDTNSAKILIGIDNPTTKIFSGVLSVSTPQGWYSNDKEVTITPGRNNFEIFLNKTTNAVSGTVTVAFKANGEQITQQVSLGGAVFAGLFAWGGLAGSFLALLLIVIVVLLIVGLISAGAPEKKEVWMEEN